MAQHLASTHLAFNTWHYVITCSNMNCSYGNAVQHGTIRTKNFQLFNYDYCASCKHIASVWKLVSESASSSILNGSKSSNSHVPITTVKLKNPPETTTFHFSLNLTFSIRLWNRLQMEIGEVNGSLEIWSKSWCFKEAGTWCLVLCFQEMRTTCLDTMYSSQKLRQNPLPVLPKKNVSF